MEPFGPRVEALQFGRLQSTVLNALGAKTDAGDCTIGDREELSPETEMTPEDLSAALSELAEGQNARIRAAREGED